MILTDIGKWSKWYLLIFINQYFMMIINADEQTICATPSCVDVAKNIKNRMNLTVNPCEDFYEFACGRFVKETPIEKGKSAVHMFEIAMNELSQQLKVLLEQPSGSSEIKPFTQTKQLYSACMDKVEIEKQGETPLLEVLRTLGGFPVLLGNDWNQQSFSWTETIKQFREIGVSSDYIMRLSVNIDSKNSSKKLIEIDQPTFQSVREFLVKGREESNVKAYYEYMRDISILLGANEEKATKEMKDMVDFEIALAQITASKEDRRNATFIYNPISIKDLQQKCSFINWLSYIKNIVPSNINIDENEIINIADLGYIQKLGKLLEETPKRTIANYLLGQLCFVSIQFLNDKLRKRRLEYLSIVEGLTEEQPRWQECIDILVRDKLPISLGAMYIRHHFNADAKRMALEMVNFIKEAFGNIIKAVDWMDDQTRSEALQKLKTMITLIAYPDELNNDQVLIKYHERLNIGKNFLDKIFKVVKFKTDMSFRTLRDRVVKDDWENWAEVAEVNAFYAPNYNFILFPAGILQGHFFSANRPQYLNYGSIGVAIGHEITHGFDDQGAQYDKDGNVRDWWNPITKELFKGKTECVVNQYNNTYDLETKMHLNGILTQGENIADYGAIKEAYFAYQHYTEVHGSEKLLPGLNYSQNQLFWTAMAQTFCSKFKTEMLKLLIESDPHALPAYRVLLPLQNNVEFAKDFQCPEGSPMNPTKKCTVW